MLGVALIDYDDDGLLDLFGANDTQPNRLYRNKGDGTFADVGVMAGVAFNEAGRRARRHGRGRRRTTTARAVQSLVIGNFSNEMMALYCERRQRTVHRRGAGVDDRPGVAAAPDVRLLLLRRRSRRPARHLRRQRTRRRRHRHASSRRSRYAQPPHLFRNLGAKKFEDVSASVGRGVHHAGGRPRRGLRRLRQRRRSRPARHGQQRPGAAPPQRRRRRITSCASRSRARRPIATPSARRVRVIRGGGQTPWRMVKTGSSYLSQSELPADVRPGQRGRRSTASKSSGRTARPNGCPASPPIGRSRSQEGKGVIAHRAVRVEAVEGRRRCARRGPGDASAAGRTAARPERRETAQAGRRPTRARRTAPTTSAWRGSSSSTTKRAAKYFREALAASRRISRSPG